jgi:cytidylate kinase
MVIVEGRDMTTRVFTRARYKFYIECGLDTRAHWRANQNGGVYAFVHNEIANRDKQDMERAIDPVRYLPELGVIKIINEKTPEEALLDILSYI